MKVLPTVELPESVTCAFAEADEEPGILRGLFPAEIAEESVGQACCKCFIDLVPLLYDVPRMQNPLIKDVQPVCKRYALLWMLRQKQVGQE